MGAGASASVPKIQALEKKRFSEIKSGGPIWVAERNDLVCHVKADLENSANFVSEVEKFLADSNSRIVDSAELRDRLTNGCKQIGTLLSHFRSEEVFTLLERVADQQKINGLGGSSDAKGVHMEHALIGILHAYSDELPHGSSDNFRVSPTKKLRKILRRVTILQARSRPEEISSVVVELAGDKQRTQLKKMEQRVTMGDWDIDVFEIEEYSGGKALQFLGTKIFQLCDFHHLFKIEQGTLESFLKALHAGYIASNPYHNATHGADVMYTVHCFFHHSARLKKELSLVDKLSAIVAAAMHDFKHNGRNNTFHKTTLSDLAIQFNDASPLENMHVAEGFKLLQHPSCNIFKAVFKDDMRVIRRNIISIILATDMAQHFNHVADFRSKLKAERHSGGKSIGAEMALKMTLHCADISNSVKPTHIYTHWAELVMGEFLEQGDEERSLGIESVQMFDRELMDMSKSQHGFITFMIQPTFEVWGAYLPELNDKFTTNLAANLAVDWAGWIAPPRKLLRA